MCWVLCNASAAFPSMEIQFLALPSSPSFKFKLCILCISLDGKISLYPGSGVAEGQP